MVIKDSISFEWDELILFKTTQIAKTQSSGMKISFQIGRHVL